MKKIFQTLPVAACAAAAWLMLAPGDAVQAQQKGAPGKGAPPAKGAPAAKGPAQAKGKGGPVEVATQHVQGNVYMIYTSNGNTTVQIGSWGVMVVDTQTAEIAPAVLAEIRKLSNAPIRYVVNTSIDQTPGNGVISRAGVPVVGGNLGNVAFDNGATIIAHENVLMGMLSAGEGKGEENPDLLPTTTFFEGQKEVFFNDEPVIVMMQSNAHTNGDTFVFFRRSDVVSAGGLMDMTSYPHIDLAKDGNINGIIAGLNRILDITIPRHQQEGGTFVVPGKGRLTDEHDVLEYRDMLVIIRDRIKAEVGKGRTLAQIKAAKLTLDYDGRYGSTSGPWTTDMFIEAVYKNVGGK